MGCLCIYFLAQTPEHTLAEPVKIPVASPAKSVLVLDVDGDGRSDLLLVNWESQTPFRFRLQDKTGQLGPELYFTMPPVRSYWADNLEENEKVQVITIAQSSGRATVWEFAHKPAEPLDGFREGQFQVLPLNKTEKPRRGLLWTDLNGDGRADLIVELMQGLISGDGDARLMSALIPVSDPRMAGFQRRSFRTDFYAAIQRAGNGKFEDVFCRPAWLNAADFDKLAKASGIKPIPRKFDSIEGLPGLLKFLGGKEAAFQNTAPALERTVPSVTGAAEIAAHLTTLFSTGQIEPQSVNPAWKLWSVGKGVVSLDEVKQGKTPFADGFVEAVVEKVGSPTELRRFMTALTDKVTAAKLIPDGEADGTSGSGAKQISKLHPQISLKRWRSAEQQVLTVLTALGWEVEDVSRQNIGYDIEGRTPDGEDAFVEVKAIDHPGQAFTLTSNEEAVARQKGKAYRLALVRQANDCLEIAFIEDPVHALKLTRQCRQWVWECGSYDFNPERFRVE